MGTFFNIFKIFTLWELKRRVMKSRVGKQQWFSLPWMGLRGGKNKSIQKKKGPMGWVLWKDALAIDAGQQL
jgi:hypothetical protein